MVGAVSTIRPYAILRAWGAHATNRRGPTPIETVREVTPILPTQRIITYQLRPDGRLEMRRGAFGHALDVSA